MLVVNDGCLPGGLAAIGLTLIKIRVSCQGFGQDRCLDTRSGLRLGIRTMPKRHKQNPDEVILEKLEEVSCLIVHEILPIAAALPATDRKKVLTNVASGLRLMQNLTRRARRQLKVSLESTDQKVSAG